MPNYHRYGLGSGLVGELIAKFPQGGGNLSLSKKHIFRDCALPYRFCYWEIHRGYVGDCTTRASPLGGEL